MKNIMRCYFLFFCVFLLSCNNNSWTIDLKQSVVFCGEDTIKIFGNPNKEVLLEYLKNDTSSVAWLNQETPFTYIFNDLMKLSVFVPDSGAYDCFIFEKVLGKKQLSYFKLDDALKYNYIPTYDSLAYDLSIRFKDDNNNCDKWSSKYEEVPNNRMLSKEYQDLVSTCNDAYQLSEFYNNSLFFQNETISGDLKKRTLTKLIEITQVQLVGLFLRNKSPKRLNIVLGFVSLRSHDYQIIKFKNLTRDTDYYRISWDLKTYRFADYLLDLHKQFEYLNPSYEFELKPYLVSIQEQNLSFLSSHLGEINNRIEKCDLFICANYLLSDTRLFFFDIKYDELGKIIISKEYYNKEFLPTTRMTNYFLSW